MKTKKIKNYIWREPVVGYAFSGDQLFKELKTIVSPSHYLPTDILYDAKAVISFFVPFDKSIIKKNAKEGEIEPSDSWHRATQLTDELIIKLCNDLQKRFQTATIKFRPVHANNFDSKKLISDWSHRHVAYIAGLGTFGINNMLITNQGSAGRLGGVVTNIDIDPSPRPQYEYCIYKYNKKCLQCVSRCVNDSFYKSNNFYYCNKKKCYEQVYIKNIKKACGKCISNVPCSTTNPVRALL